MKRPLTTPCKRYKVKLTVVPSLNQDKPELPSPPPFTFTRTEKLKAFCELARKHPLIIIDAQFDQYHNDRARKSLVQQLAYSYHEAMSRECLLYICGVSLPILEALRKNKADSWQAYVTTRTIEQLSLGENRFDPHDPVGEAGIRLIYLTADSDQVLDEDCIAQDESAPEFYKLGYVVGGLIDRNRFKGTCYRKARNLRLEHRSLPISGRLAEIGCKVLTTNHVVGVLCRRFSEGMGWSEALDEVVPARKIGSHAAPLSGAPVLTSEVTQVENAAAAANRSAVGGTADC